MFSQKRPPSKGVGSRSRMLLLLLIFIVATGCCSSRVVNLKKAKSGFFSYKNRESEVQAMTHFSYAQHLVLDGHGDKATQELKAALRADPDSAYLHEILGYLLLQQGKPDQALAMVKQALQIDPNRSVSYHLMGMTLLTKGDFAEAEDALVRASVMEPDNTEYAINLAEARTRQGKTTEAIVGLSKFAANHPNEIEPQYYAATILQEVGQMDKAAKIYRAVITRSPSYYPALHDLFLLEAARGNLDDAKILGWSLLTFYPYDSDSRLLLASVLLKNREDDRALMVLEGGKQSGVLIPDWWIRAGIIMLKNKRAGEAKEQFEAALSLDPQGAEAVFYLGLVELELENRIEAISYFESVPADSPAYIQARNQLAMIALKDGEVERAVSIMEKLLEKDPDNLSIILAFSTVCRQVDEYGRARKVIQQALKKNPDEENLIYELGMINYLQGNTDEAMEIMQKIIEKNPRSARALNFVGYSWAEQGVRLDEAEANIQKALKITPNAGYIMDSMGWVYFQRAEYEKALEWMEKAEQSEGSDPEITEHMGDCYKKLGRVDKARAKYEQAIENTNSIKIKHRIQWKLERLE